MTAKQFRKLAVTLPEVVEQAHMGHPDFRVRGKIFATLGPGGDWGMVKLSAEEQASFCGLDPAVFHPASGAWGRRGCTIVRLHDADEPSVRQALIAAWRNTAPRKLVQEHDADYPGPLA